MTEPTLRPGAPPVSGTPSPGTAPDRRPWYHWRRWGLNFLTVSLLAHVFFGLGATYFIVQTIQAKRKQTFAGPPSGPSAPAHALEHKVQMQKKQQTMSAPAAAKRVTTTSNSAVALPAMPAMPALSAVAPVSMAGMGGTGVGLSLGGGGGGGGGGGLGQTLFGFRGGSAVGLEGTFYDYKMDQGYQPIKDTGRDAFAKIVRDVLPATGPWHPDTPYRHFTSAAKLHGKFFMYPAIQDREAGAAFQSPRSGPGSWLGVYRGAFSSENSGSFRFVGFGDNVMIVQVGDKIVLDASDHGYTGLPRERVGNIHFPAKGGTPIFAGQWFQMDAGEAKDISIAVGDEGGIFCSGLFIQPKSMTYANGENGVPKLPIFVLGPVTDGDRQLLKFLPPASWQGTSFRARTPQGAGGIFSH